MYGFVLNSIMPLFLSLSALILDEKKGNLRIITQWHKNDLRDDLQFYNFSKVFQSYHDDGRVIMKG